MIASRAALRRLNLALQLGALRRKLLAQRLHLSLGRSSGFALPFHDLDGAQHLLLKRLELIHTDTGTHARSIAVCGVDFSSRASRGLVNTEFRRPARLGKMPFLGYSLCATGLFHGRDGSASATQHLGEARIQLVPIEEVLASVC